MTRAYFDSIRCIAFDFCGTLAALEPSSTEILRDWLASQGRVQIESERLDAALEMAGSEFPYSSLRITDGLARRQHYVRFNTRVLELLGCDERDGAALYAHFRRYDRHWVLKPGARDVLESLRSRGYRIVLASNFDANLVELLARDGITGFFDAFFVSGEMGVEKPDPAFYGHVRRAVGCPGEIAMVGDDLRLDVFPARQAGFMPVHIRPGSMSDGGARYVADAEYVEIARLEDLLQLCAPLTGGEVAGCGAPAPRDLDGC